MRTLDKAGGARGLEVQKFRYLGTRVLGKIQLNMSGGARDTRQGWRSKRALDKDRKAGRNWTRVEEQETSVHVRRSKRTLGKA